MRVPSTLALFRLVVLLVRRDFSAAAVSPDGGGASFLPPSQSGARLRRTRCVTIEPPRNNHFDGSARRRDRLAGGIGVGPVAVRPSAVSGSRHRRDRRRDGGARTSLHASPFAITFFGNAAAAAATTTTTTGISSPSASFFSSVAAIPRLRSVAAAAAIVVLIVLNYRRILWPGSSPDPSVSAPLPEGELGCPYVGIMGAFGVGKKKRKEIDLDQPRLWKTYALLTPFVFVSGSERIKEVLNREFQDPGYRMATIFPNERKLLGGESLFLSKDKEEHSFLRRLVGQAMTPASISKAMPRLQRIASDHVEELLLSSSSSSSSPPSTNVVMEDACRNFTLDVAGRQIVGLDLAGSKEKSAAFGRAIDEWLGGLLSLPVLFLPYIGFTRAARARRYLEGEIRREIDALRRDGPKDGSTLSAMVYATDEDEDDEGGGEGGGGKERSAFSSSRGRLTDEQIVDNVLFLMLAGSETSASTLTNAVLLLGLHPRAWEAVAKEQRSLVATHGEALAATQLERDCPYLDAVVRETMRLKSISGGQYRTPTRTMVVDGSQIPKGWAVGYSIKRTHQLDPVTRKEDGSHMDIRKGFVPERWLGDDDDDDDDEGGGARRPGSEFMPFGYGPRYCLGSPLAMAEMKTFLAVLARKADFDLVTEYGEDENIEWKKTDIIPIPKDGVVVSVRPALCPVP